MKERIEWSTENWTLNKLIPYDKNPRIITEVGLDQLKESFDEIGFAQPVNINTDGTILSGHARVQQLRREFTESVDVYIPNRKLTPKEEEAVIIRMNKNVAGSWDIQSLNSEEWNQDELLEWGFTEEELDIPEIESIESSEQDDVVPELQDDPITKKGDIWLLGKHRVMCGDSTMIDDVEKLMKGEKADMVFTDPPYNIASDSKNFAANTSKAMDDLKNAEWDKNFNIMDFLSLLPTITKDSCTYYVWTSHFLISDIWEFAKESMDFHGYLVWDKPNPMPSLSKRHPTWNTELCAYFTRGSKRDVNFPSGEHFLSCREVVKKSDGSHPTQKPLELIEPLISFSSNQGKVILDSFLGSGSTLIAAEKTNRKCYGMELDEKYCDVIIKRWEEFTGESATLESSGESYKQLVEQSARNVEQ